MDNWTEAKLAQLFVEGLDRVAYALTFARLWFFDVIHGPEPPTPADEKREADRERLEKAFPNLDFDETMAVADEDWYAQAKLTAPLTASGAAPPRSAASAYRPAPLDSSSGCKPRRGRLDLRPARLAPGAARWVALLDTSGRLNGPQGAT